ncbi:recombination-associated protein RdgC [Ectothiorhodospira variabilis]|uniref:recombination-associated protein RdgC n=1 Tax=Ectothiorhodospira variabilis TaxID=505694 RepID=UPI001EFA55FF|nr:recombination-associated protein RdgC [Ectothiorhodospira variabilis]MCG5497010.1 recombination-associated protein RdgC [Ectothiorhodospira variabilis]
MFKNARLFRLGDPLGLSASELEDKLADHRFKPCGPLTLSTMGWTEPLGSDTTALVHGAAGCLLICARRQERLLPSSVVAEMLEERVAEIEAGEARSVGRAERKQLREAITAELLPQAFTRSRRLMAYVDTVAGWLVVDASSERLADDLVSLLRESLGSLPAALPQPANPPASLMTRWVSQGHGDEGFELGDACELRDPTDTQSVVRCRGQDLTGEEIAKHLEVGKQVVQLALDWNERLNFVLADDLSIKRLRMADELIEEGGVAEAEDAVARMDAEFTLLGHEMRGLIQRLETVFELPQPVSSEAVPW